MQSFTTLTLCDAGENHTGNQIIGQKLERGIMFETLRIACDDLNAQSLAKGQEEVAARLHSIKELSGLASAGAAVPDAHVLVIKDGVNKLTAGNLDEFKRELSEKVVDTKYFAYGQVRTKHARHNYMFGTNSQTADYQNKKGTVYAWSANAMVDALRRSVSVWLGLDDPLPAGEVNHYFDVSRCGIGWHGDSERRVVVGARVGASEAAPLMFRCHDNGKPIGETVKVDLADGDVYVMSEYAVGERWKSKGAHWRHATGAPKYAGDPDALWEAKQSAKARKRVRENRGGMGWKWDGRDGEHVCEK